MFTNEPTDKKTDNTNNPYGWYEKMKEGAKREREERGKEWSENQRLDREKHLKKRAETQELWGKALVKLSERDERERAKERERLEEEARKRIDEEVSAKMNLLNERERKYNDALRELGKNLF